MSFVMPHRLRNWERRSPDRRTRRDAPRHRKAFGCSKTQRARLRRVGRSGDRPSQLAQAFFWRAAVFENAPMKQEVRND